MTNEEFEKELDKMYDAIDQKQSKMEELGLINYGDRAYYIRNPEEYEKDRKICELESEIERLEYFLKVSEKALELACEMICGLAVFDKLGYEKAIAENCEYFKEKAKEKNEK